jgi:hypothetical protein
MSKPLGSAKPKLKNTAVEIQMFFDILKLQIYVRTTSTKLTFFSTQQQTELFNSEGRFYHDPQ